MGARERLRPGEHEHPGDCARGTLPAHDPLHDARRLLDRDDGRGAARGAGRTTSASPTTPTCSVVSALALLAVGVAIGFFLLETERSARASHHRRIAPLAGACRDHRRRLLRALLRGHGLVLERRLHAQLVGASSCARGPHLRSLLADDDGRPLARRPIGDEDGSGRRWCVPGALTAVCGLGTGAGLSDAGVRAHRVRALRARALLSGADALPRRRPAAAARGAGTGRGARAPPGPPSCSWGR